MKHLITLTLICFITLASSVAYAESSHHQLERHLHGTATLQVAVDKQSLTLFFSSPLDNLLGFERKPRTQAEVKQVQHMINQFYKNNVFLPSKAAQCKLQNIKLESLVIKKKPQSVHKHDEAESGHAELDAEIVYQCNQVKNLRDLQVNLFKAFPNLHQLNVEIVSERGQLAATLTASKNQAFW
jgi:hypothetical protein